MILLYNDKIYDMIYLEKKWHVGTEGRRDPIILEWVGSSAKIVNGVEGGMTAGKSWLLNQKEDDRWPLTAPKKKVRVSRFEDRDRRHTRHGHWLLKEQGHQGPPSNWTSCKTIALGKKLFRFGWHCLGVNLITHLQIGPQENFFCNCFYQISVFANCHNESFFLQIVIVNNFFFCKLL